MANPQIDSVRKLLNRGVTIAEIVDMSVAPTVSAMTAPATMNAAYTQSEVQALRTDVANLRATVAALITALQGSNQLL